MEIRKANGLSPMGKIIKKLNEALDDLEEKVEEGMTTTEEMTRFMRGYFMAMYETDQITKEDAFYVGILLTTLETNFLP